MGFPRSKKDDFSRSGPKHLTSETGYRTNADHTRSVVACLVQGVYAMERDRQKERKGSKALAPSWWKSFDFKLRDTLKDDADFSIFGAIYEFKPPPASNSNLPTDGIPRYVIAFRGTLLKRSSLKRDMKLNVHTIRSDLHLTSCLEIAIQAVRNMVDSKGSSNVWLAGHSLGAAIALVAGKTMAKTGVFLQSFLFNPPYLSAPIERIKHKKVKHGIQIAGSLITAGLAFAMNHNNQSADSFLALSPWVPCLYVNPADDICSGYIEYFKHRKWMEEKGLRCIERVATQHSVVSLFMNAMGKESEPIDLIPTAHLTVNLTTSHDCEQPHGILQWWRSFKQAHGIEQWWRPDQHLESKLYSCNCFR